MPLRLVPSSEDSSQGEIKDRDLFRTATSATRGARPSDSDPSGRFLPAKLASLRLWIVHGFAPIPSTSE